MKRTLTPWFPPHIQPVRVGVYNANVTQNPEILRHWDGSTWSYGWVADDIPAIISYCMGQRNSTQKNHTIRWRGLAAGPIEEAK